MYLTKISRKGSSPESIEIIRELDEAEFIEIKNAISEINEIEYSSNLVRIIFQNKADFIEQVSDIRISSFIKSSITSYGLNKEKSNHYYNNLDRLFLNYLCSIRTFLDHSQTYLNRKYGQDSIQFNGFKLITKSLFETFFEYRFISKLRNYCQHVGMPLDKHFEINFCEDNSINGQLYIEFDPKRLLETFDDWGKLVSSDLKKIDKRINALPIINLVTDQMILIKVEIDKLRTKEVEKAAKLIKLLTSAHRENNFEICIIDSIPNPIGNQKINVTIQHFPFSVLDLLQV